MTRVIVRRILVPAAVVLSAALLLGALNSPKGFDPAPQILDSRELRETVKEARLTIVFAPARPGCGSCIVPPVATLNRFVATYPEARVLTALQPGLRVGGDVVVGRRFDLEGRTGPRFAGQDLGVVAAFDSAGRTLLFRVLTHPAFDALYGDLENAYSLTAPKGSRWASAEARP